jgi:hypothetical protein
MVPQVQIRNEIRNQDSELPNRNTTAGKECK